jgi:hypothetical protein
MDSVIGVLHFYMSGFNQVQQQVQALDVNTPNRKHVILLAQIVCQGSAVATNEHQDESLKASVEGTI